MCLHSEFEDEPELYDYSDFAEINLGEKYKTSELITRMEKLLIEVGIKKERLKSFVLNGVSRDELFDLFLRYLALKAAFLVHFNLDFLMVSDLVTWSRGEV